MKINSLNNLSFSKKLVATCAIKGAKGNIPCSISKIEEEDKDYFIHLIYKPGWKNYLYATIIDGDIRRGNADTIYVMEDKKENCLGFMEIFTKNSNKNSLEFIEVKPACRNKNSKRTVKYIGETMMNFLAQVTKMSGKKYVSVPHPDSEAIGFYKKCFCALSGQTQGFTLAEDNMDKLKISNFEHTGAEINILSQYKK